VKAPGWWRRDAADDRREASRRLDDRQLAAFARVKALVLDCDGVLTRGDLIYGPQGEALKSFHARDGLGLVLARTAGLRLVLITGRDSAIAARRAEELHFDAVKVGRFDKRQALEEVMAELSLDADEILYMGDDLIDLPALDAAGVAVTVPEAPAAVRERCLYVTEAAGGAGAVREATDLVLKSRGLLGEALARLAAAAASPGEERQ
jgi:3-deoxy-D-manno-octulosonate 8-phosphate phosphatase (KDO 8-P phosphatase)